MWFLHVVHMASFQLEAFNSCYPDSLWGLPNIYVPLFFNPPLDRSPFLFSWFFFFMKKNHRVTVSYFIVLDLNGTNDFIYLKHPSLGDCLLLVQGSSGKEGFIPVEWPFRACLGIVWLAKREGRWDYFSIVMSAVRNNSTKVYQCSKLRPVRPCLLTCFNSGISLSWSVEADFLWVKM